MENLEYIIVTDFGVRIDQYLSDYYEDISRSKLSKLIKEGNVLVNDEKVKPSYLVQEGDRIAIDLNGLEIEPLVGQDLPIEIIYQDDDLAIINKPQGILSHPTNTIRTNTLVNFLINKFENLPTLNGKDRAGIVHRLDLDTSGLMIVALNDKSMVKLQDMFRDRTIIKKYRTIVNGGFSDNHGVIELPIGRSTKNRKLRMVSQDGKYSKTEYTVLEQNQAYSYLDIILHTGRTHQIRVHMAYKSHPILGDKDYNNIKSNYSVDKQLLQAYYLEFDHPISGQKLVFQIEPYPEFKKYYNLIFEGEV